MGRTTYESARAPDERAGDGCDAIGAGKKEKVSVDFFEEVPADAVFRVEFVERYAE